MITKEQIETITKTAASLRESIAELEAANNVAILDGTPYLIVGEAHPEGCEPFTMVYGHFDGVDCFKSLDIQPNHFCGCYMVSPESARKAIARIPAGFNLTNPRALHVRDARAARIERQRTALAHVEAFLAKEGGAL
jgi:hypothetical protein